MADFSPDYAKFTITTSGQQDAFLERRFDRNITIADLKGKLELLTGGNASTMKIELYTKDSVYVGTCDNDEACLGSYIKHDEMRLHVVDIFAQRKEFEDVSKVEKFELSLEEYSKRTGTVRSFLEQNKLGKYNAEEMKQKEEVKRQEMEADEIAAKATKVGDRCEVRVPGQPVRKATIMFIGTVDFSKGWWIGVRYDEPLGKNDGMVDGKRYFECYPKYGGFVKPIYVTVGDFPEETLDIEEEL